MPVENPPAPRLRRNRDFQLLWIGSAVSLLGSRASSIAYPLVVLALTGSASQAGLVGFAATLPFLLLQLPLGSLADGWDRRRVLLGADVGRFALLGLMAVAVLTGHAYLPLIMVVAFAEGALTVLGDAVEPGAVRQLVRPEQFSDALAQQEARDRAAMLLGQPVGGALFAVGRAVPFLFDAVTYLVSVTTLLLIRRPLQEKRAPGRGRALSRHEVSRGVAWLWARPFFRATSLLVAGSNLLFQMLTLALIVSATQQRASSFLIGVIIAGSGVGGIVGAALASRVNRALALPKVIVLTHWVWALVMPVFVFVQVPVAYPVLFAALAFVGPLWNVGVLTARVSATPDELQGRVMAASKVLSFGAIPLGSLLGGLALDGLGTTTTFVLLAAVMAVLALLATAAPSVRRGPASGPQGAAGPAVTGEPAAPAADARIHDPTDGENP